MNLWGMKKSALGLGADWIKTLIFPIPNPKFTKKRGGGGGGWTASPIFIGSFDPIKFFALHAMPCLKPRTSSKFGSLPTQLLMSVNNFSMLIMRKYCRHLHSLSPSPSCM